MGLFLALCLAALPANAEVKSKPPAPEENVYRLFVSINRRCEATVHVENIKTGWNRDYILSAEELDAAVEWSRNVGTVATKSVVLVDYGRDIGAFFRGSTRAALYAFVLSAVSKRVLGDPGKWARRRFFWVSVAAGGALEVANLYIFGDPEETKGQRILREALLKFEALEEDVPTALAEIRARMPAKTEAIRDGSCQDFAYPAKLADKTYTNMLIIGLNLGIERGGKR